MKIILSFSMAVLIYLGFSLNLLNQVDFKGTYHSIHKSPKIISEQLSLGIDGLFEYHLYSIDAMTSNTYRIKGHYRIQGNQLRLSPSVFENNTTALKSLAKDARVNVRDTKKADTNTKVIDKNSPRLFQQYLTSFRSGDSRLSPNYYLKQTKDKLSLCQIDIKTEQYQAQFLKTK